ncbi:MAG: hypothetical protein AAB215_08155 [Planctomycetota bacterium]
MSVVITKRPGGRASEALALALAAFAFSGCGLNRYLVARAADAADLVQANAGAGPGLLVSLKATEFAHVAAGYSNDWKWGFLGRHTGAWREENLGFPVSNIGEFHAAPSLRLLSALACFQAREVGPFVRGDAEFFWRRLDSRAGKTASPWIDKFDVEAGATAGFVNVRLGISPGQALDFLLGVFTIDLAGDDAPAGAEAP